MASRAAEKINDLFLVSLSDLEQGIVSQVIKLSNHPTKLIEELQYQINEYKQRFYNSLIQLITFITNQNSKDIHVISSNLEAEIVKFKQKQLLFQMKAITNQKIKALLDTLNYESISDSKKSQLTKQMQLLADSLQKIETTLYGASPSQSNFITPLPNRMQFDMLTPQLSEEAEQKVKLNYITPDINRQNNQIPQQFLRPSTTQNNMLETSHLLNSFNHDPLEHTNLQTETDNIQQIFQFAISNDQKKPPQPQKVKKVHSTSSLVPQTPDISNQKKFNTTRTKEQQKRKRPSFQAESVNLLSKLNQADEQKKSKKGKEGKEGKENKDSINRGKQPKTIKRIK